MILPTSLAALAVSLFTSSLFTLNADRLENATLRQELQGAARTEAEKAPQGPQQTPEGGWVNKLPWRQLGPANMSGRIVALAVNPHDYGNYWVATASGGVLKTINGGTTYTHQFDRENTVSIGHLALAPSNPDILWVGTGESNPRNSVSYGDGVYKSTDGGETWTNMGLRKTFQIGQIAIHPTNPDIVYVGALGRLYGPNEERGLFKTVDGGKTWERIYFVDDKTGIIDIDMHPMDPDTLIVATYERERDGFDTNDPAKKWGPGSGLVRTQDGGQTWEKLTAGLPTVNLGRIGVDYYYSDPNIVYAVVESERIAKLPEDAAFMGISSESADVGARLTSITEEGPAAKAELEEGDILIGIGQDRILSSSDLTKAIRNYKAGDSVKIEFVRDREFKETEITFAELPEEGSNRSPFSGGLGGQRENVQDEQGRGSIETGGIYKSEDGGSSWTRVNSLNPRPMYFSQIRVDPSDANYIYVLGISLYRSEDGGKSFSGDGGRGGVHVDHHALWVNPNDGRHILLGNDGGVYVTHDRMRNWDHHNHMAIGQFYHVTTDNLPFYNVYGGLQDNGSWGGPNRSRNRTGVVNSDWISIGGGDGFVCRVDPEDPEQIYFESQNGGMGRIHLGTGERGFIRPRAPRGTRYRFNWKTPFLLSHHNSKIYYTAGNHVFRSLNKGDRLKAVSPEITNSDRGSATALAESIHDPDVLYVGTDDGALHMTQDGGTTWINLYDPPAEEAAKSEDSQTPGPIPGDEISGRWKVELTGDRIPRGRGEFYLDLKLEEGGKLSGKVRASEISSGKFNPETKSVEIRYEGFRGGEAVLKGAVKDGVLKGTMSMGGGNFEMEFSAKRENPPPGEPLAAVDLIVLLDSEASPATEVVLTTDPVSGEWEGEIDSEQVPEEGSNFTIRLELKDKGEVEGVLSSEMGEINIENGKYDAEKKTLSMSFDMGGADGDIKGKVDKDRFVGQLNAMGGAFSMDLTAKRTKKPKQDPQMPSLESSITFEVDAESWEMVPNRPGRGRPAGARGRQSRQEVPGGQPLKELVPATNLWVSSLEISRFEESRVYLCLDGHRSNYDDPFVFVSEDYGRTWSSLRSNLPRGSSRVLREDLENPELLYLGTEFGLWVSLNRGQSWEKLQANFPTVAVHEIAQHPTVGEVVIGTHGRSLWAGDVSSLRQMTAENMSEKAFLFKPNTVYQWRNLPSRGSSGLRRFQGQNPPGGAQLTYHLREDVDSIRLEIQSLDGQVLRELEPSKESGLYQTRWDLRQQPAQQDGSNRRRRRGRMSGPGTYKVVLTVDGQTQSQLLEIKGDPDYPNSMRPFETEEELWTEESAEIGSSKSPDASEIH